MARLLKTVDPRDYYRGFGAKGLAIRVLDTVRRWLEGAVVFFIERIERASPKPAPSMRKETTIEDNTVAARPLGDLGSYAPGGIVRTRGQRYRNRRQWSVFGEDE